MTRIPKPAETDVGSGRQPLVSDAAGRGIPSAELNWENEGGRLRRPQHAAKTYPAPQDRGAPERLAAEHADLLRNVVARADDVLATAATSRWPERELADLIDYLRSELITQTRIEEQLLFANAEHSSSEAMSRLARDHVRLRYALEALTDFAGHRGRRDAQSLAATVRGLVTQLSEHLRQEREVLSRHAGDTAWQQAMDAMDHRPHAWYPLTHAPVINLDAFPSGQALEAVSPRVQQLHPGDQLELTGSADPKLLCSRLLRDQDIAVNYLVDGPQAWHVTVTRRTAE
jgi:uncharacterized protein (DUF2249 family)